MRDPTQWAGLLVCACLLLASTERAGAAEGLALLDHVPADTPYYYAMLEPLPEGLAKRMLDLSGEGWDAISRMAEKAAAAEPDMRRVAKVIRLIAVELEGARGEEALARLGLSSTARAVLYGVGAMPILRMELKDGPTLRGVVDRATAVAEVTLPMRKHRGVAYWHIEHPDGVLAVAILEHTLVASFAPKEAMRHLLPYVLGKKKPRKAMKAASVRALAKKHRLLPHTLGFVDTVGIAKMLLGKARGEHRKVAAAVRKGWKRPAKICRKEVLSLAAKAPRAVFGYERLDEKRVDMAYLLELSRDLVKDLRGMRAPVPGLIARPNKGPLATLGLGVSPTLAMDVLERRAKALVNKPYRCPDLAEINRAARKIYTAVAPPRSPLWSSVSGGIFRLDAIELPSSGPGGGQMPKVKAACLLAADRPDALIEIAKGFVPGLAGMVLPKDGKPVLLPAGALLPGASPVYLARGAKAVAVSMGEGAQNLLPAMLKAASAKAPPLVELGYAAGRLAKMSLDASNKALEAGAQQDPAVREMHENMERMQRLWGIFEHESVSLLVDGTGLRVLVRMWLGPEE